MPKIIETENDNKYDKPKIGMDVIPRGVVKRHLNPSGLGHKIHNSRNRKKCFLCGTYDNVIEKEVIIFGYQTLSYVCINCKNRL